MLNWIWLTLVLGSIALGAFAGRMEAVTTASIESAKSAVTLSIDLIGMMALWLGIMKVAQDAGLLKAVARGLRPLMARLFPEVPATHPAMSAMILNISSNMIGLANAATPFGIKAMEELDKLNKKKGVATNAMALFLAINSSNVALLPLGAIAIRAAAGSTNPGSIIITTLMATTCSTVVAVLAVKLLQCLPRYRLVGEEVVLQQDVSPSLEEESEKEGDNHASVPALVRWTTLLLFFGAVVWGIFSYLQNTTLPLSDAVQTILSQWLLLLLMGGILVWGLMKQVKVYESLIEGAKEGFQVAIRIIPFLVAILVAVGMFRASGGLEFLISLISPLTNLIGMPAETLPMAILRPLTGSGAFGVMTETLKTYGPDSLIGNIVSTMQGSTETTFYIFAVYCGAIGVKNVRHALPACLLADAAGFLAAVYACRWLLG